MSEPNPAAAPIAPQPVKKYVHEFQDLRGNTDPVDVDVDMPGWTPPADKAPDAPEPELEPPKKPDDEPPEEEPPPDDDTTLSPQALAATDDVLRQQLEDTQRRLATMEQERVTERQQNEQRQFHDWTVRMDADQSAGERKVNDINSQIQKAYEAGNSIELTRLNNELTDLKLDQKLRGNALQQAKAQAVQRAQQPAPQPQPQQPATKPLPAQAVGWIARNKWFNDARYDGERSFAMAIDRQLTAENRFNANDPAYYAELDKRIGKAFPSLVPGARKPVTPAPVRGAPAPRARPGVVRLTAQDQTSMKKFGLDPGNKAHVLAWAKSKAAAPE